MSDAKQAECSSNHAMSISAFIEMIGEELNRQEKRFLSIRESLEKAKTFSLKEGDFIVTKDYKKKGLLVGIALGTSEMKIRKDQIDTFVAHVVTAKGIEFMDLDEIVPYTTASKLLYEKVNNVRG